MNRREFLSRAGIGTASLLASPLPLEAAERSRRPNVLFIAVDDLNDWCGCYAGHPQAKTRNIDRLASRGVLFTNAHCQAPICNPSRVSLLTGLLPSSTGVYFLGPQLRRTALLSGAVTLPQYFGQHGYRTLGGGKIFHGRQDPASFQVQGGSFGGFGPFPKKKIAYPKGAKLWDWGAFPASDAEMPDRKLAGWAADQLKALGADQSKPFFLAVGFWRPHVPMYAPAKWFDLHPRGAVQLPEVRDDDWADLSTYAKKLTHSGAAPRHDWIVKNGEWTHAVQAYLAAVSFVDSCVGHVLDALEASGAAGNTVVVLWADHGFHLGEKLRWAKRSLWEESTRVPLIIAGPGVQPGAICTRPVGLIDIFPTLVEQCNLPAKGGLEGRSIAPLLRSPRMAWERPAITTFGPNNHSVRSERWRYIRYADGSEELYDHENDPNEWDNLAGSPEHAQVIRDHARWLPKTNLPCAPGSSGSGSPLYRKVENAARRSRESRARH